jgi:hypothetical protein
LRHTRPLPNHRTPRPLAARHHVTITTNFITPPAAVFKITLPCSGKITDEVDVQVLINIMGLVPVSSGPAGQLQQDSQDAEEDADGLGQSAAAGEASSSVSDYQLARAVQQQSELLAAGGQAGSPPTSAGGPANSSTANSGADQMQADQQQAAGEPALGATGAAAVGQTKRLAAGQQGLMQQPPMRMVSHTLAIKRKKICTMHPVPVQPAHPRHPEIRPPNQPPQLIGSVPPPPPPPIQNNEISSPAPKANWPKGATAFDQQQQQVSSERGSVKVRACSRASDAANRRQRGESAGRLKASLLVHGAILILCGDGANRARSSGASHQRQGLWPAGLPRWKQ